jgi:hypothetical protein
MGMLRQREVEKELNARQEYEYLMMRGMMGLRHEQSQKMDMKANAPISN